MPNGYHPPEAKAQTTREEIIAECVELRQQVMDMVNGMDLSDLSDASMFDLYELREGLWNARRDLEF